MNVAVKHTFIQVSAIADRDASMRCCSCPPTLRDDGFIITKEPDLEHDTMYAKQMLAEGSVSPTSTVSTQSGEHTVCTHEGAQQAEVATRKSKRHPRPCKGKRLRYKKFVESLRAEIETKAGSFNIDDVAWPPSLQENPRRRQRVILLMEQFQQQLWNSCAQG